MLIFCRLLLKRYVSLVLTVCVPSQLLQTSYAQNATNKTGLNLLAARLELALGTSCHRTQRIFVPLSTASIHSRRHQELEFVRNTLAYLPVTFTRAGPSSQSSKSPSVAHLLAT